MKTEVEHRVPLSTQVVAQLRALRPGKPTDYIFPSEKEGKPLSDMAMIAFIRRQNKDESVWKDAQDAEITQHGFRSTFSTWARK